MAAGDQPDLPPIDFNHQEVFDDESDTDDESDESSMDGFDIETDEEVEEYMVETLIAEQDSDDIRTEHADLQRRHAEMVEEDRANKVALEERRQAVKRKLAEREEWFRLKRLRTSVESAYEAMNEASPLIDGGGAVGSVGDGGVAGGAQPSAAEVVAAMERFETAVLTARRSLNELTLHQQKMDEN